MHPNMKEVLVSKITSVIRGVKLGSLFKARIAQWYAYSCVYNIMERRGKMTVGEMIRKLKSEGVVFKKHGKKHDIYYNPKTGSEAQIPRHQTEELKKGTAEKILKDLGLK